MKYLLFMFRGPLQSWGLDACKETRTTSDHPTKSGVIGYLSLCLGLIRGDENICDLNSILGYACRTDLPGRPIEDYCTFTIHPEDIQNEKKRKKMDFSDPGYTKQVYKHYLEQAAFTICVWEKESMEILDEFRKAILTPTFLPYLGRKSCRFSSHPFPKIIEADSVEEAFKKYGPSMVIRRNKALYIEGVGQDTRYVMDDMFKDRGFRKRPEYMVLEGA